jgi:hypothetical protein
MESLPIKNPVSPFFKTTETQRLTELLNARLELNASLCPAVPLWLKSVVPRSQEYEKRALSH